MNLSTLECPLCPFNVTAEDSYWLQLHFEQEHTPGSGFKITDESASRQTVAGDFCSNEDEPYESPRDEDEEYILCPEKDCGETLLLSDINDHLDLHNLERLAETSRRQTPEPSIVSSVAGREGKDPKERGISEKEGLRRSITDLGEHEAASRKKTRRKGLKKARLGRAELGPYAWEEKMPSWLHKQLAEQPKRITRNCIGYDGRIVREERIENVTTGIVPVLAQLSEADDCVCKAYYCHPAVSHVFKTRREGGFCGYRNAQMLISYIQDSKAQGVTHFSSRMPNVLQLQDMIEDAWDRGFNEVCRDQTGGIKGTRKYIGTPEVQALFRSLEISTEVGYFSDNEQRGQANEQLLAYIEEYFKKAALDIDAKVQRTLLPPVYLQRPGHSLTIVGLEIMEHSNKTLVVLDPMFESSPGMSRLLGRRDISTPRPKVMELYRRDKKKLKRHRDFETLTLTSSAPISDAWHS